MSYGNPPGGGYGAPPPPPGGGYGAAQPPAGGGGGYGGGAPPSNYLVPSIISLICCGGLFAIPAIIFATQVNSKWNAGDYQGAMDSSNKAKTWCIIAYAIGIIGGIIGGIFYAYALSQTPQIPSTYP
jgi:hypothetical protein